MSRAPMVKSSPARRHPVLAVCALGLLGAACERTPDRSHQPACDETELADFAGWLHQLDEEGFMAPWVPNRRALAQLPAKPRDAVLLPDNALIVMDSYGVSVQGVTAGYFRGSARRFHLDERMLRAELGRDPEETPVIVVAIAPDVAWGVASAVLEVAAGDGRPFVFAIRTPTKVAPPPTSRLDSALREWFAQPNLLRMPPLIARIDNSAEGNIQGYVYARCPQALEAMPELTRGEYADELIAGLHACDCNVDLDEARSFHWAHYGRYFGVVFGIPAQLRHGDSPFAADTPWRDVVRRLAATEAPRTLILP